MVLCEELTSINILFKGYKLGFNYLKDKRYYDAIDISHYVSITLIK